MIKFFLGSVLLVAFVFAHAQEVPNTNSMQRSTAVVDIQDLVEEGFNFWEDEFKGHWTGFHLGINNFGSVSYAGYPEEEHHFLDLDTWHSTRLDLNLLQLSKGLQRNRNTIGLLTGLGLELQTYQLGQNTTIEQTPIRVVPQTLFFDSNQKSKLSSVYLNLPLLAEFQIPVNNYANRLYLSGGVVLGKRLSTHTKIKYRKNGKKEKLKTPDDYFMHEYRWSAMVRMGYRWVNLYATYDLQPLFIDTRAPNVYPFSVGVSLITF